MPSVFVRREDYSQEESWRLVEWCRTRGADEFGLVFIGPPYLPESAWAEADTLLASFRRRVASAGDRWALTGESVAVLRVLLPEGLFTSVSGDRSLEEVTIYRGGLVLLAVIQPEGEGVLDLHPADERSLEGAGLRFHRAHRRG